MRRLLCAAGNYEVCSCASGSEVPFDTKSGWGMLETPENSIQTREMKGGTNEKVQSCVGDFDGCGSRLGHGKCGICRVLLLIQWSSKATGCGR